MQQQLPDVSGGGYGGQQYNQYGGNGAYLQGTADPMLLGQELYPQQQQQMMSYHNSIPLDPNMLPPGYSQYPQQLQQPAYNMLGAGNPANTQRSGGDGLQSVRQSHHYYKNQESKGSYLTQGTANVGTDMEQLILEEMQLRSGQHTNNTLERIDSLERKLSIAMDNKEGGNYAQICQIYSNIINNAEMASQKINSSDPLKKQWYKRVLQYQMKEKIFRDKLAKQEQRKAEEEAEKKAQAKAFAEAMAAKAEQEKVMNEVAQTQMQNQQMAQNAQQQNNPSTGGGQGTTFYPNQQQNNQPQQNMQIQQQPQQQYRQENIDIYAQTSNSKGNLLQQQQTFEDNNNNNYGNNYEQQYPPPQQNMQYQQYQQQPAPMMMMNPSVAAQQVFAQQAKEMFTALTDIVQDAIQETKKNLKMTANLSDTISNAPSEDFHSGEPSRIHNNNKHRNDQRYNNNTNHHNSHLQLPGDNSRIGLQSKSSLPGYSKWEHVGPNASGIKHQGHEYPQSQSGRMPHNGGGLRESQSRGNVSNKWQQNQHIQEAEYEDDEHSPNHRPMNYDDMPIPTLQNKQGGRPSYPEEYPPGGHEAVQQRQSPKNAPSSKYAPASQNQQQRHQQLSSIDLSHNLTTPPHEQSLEFNNMTEEESIRQRRREKMKQNHMKRLKTIEQQKKNSESSPFISQRTDVQDLILHKPVPQKGFLPPFNPVDDQYHEDVGFQQPPYQPYEYERQGPGAYQEEMNPHSYNDAPNNPNQLSARERDPRRINSGGKKQTSDLLPLKPSSLLKNLPPEVANDTEIKQQLESFQEKQRKVLEDFQQDIEKMANDQQQRVTPSNQRVPRSHNDQHHREQHQHEHRDQHQHNKAAHNHRNHQSHQDDNHHLVGSQANYRHQQPKIEHALGNSHHQAQEIPNRAAPWRHQQPQNSDLLPPKHQAHLSNSRPWVTRQESVDQIQQEEQFKYNDRQLNQEQIRTHGHSQIQNQYRNQQKNAHYSEDDGLQRQHPTRSKHRDMEQGRTHKNEQQSKKQHPYVKQRSEEYQQSTTQQRLSWHQKDRQQYQNDHDERPVKPMPTRGHYNSDDQLSRQQTNEGLGDERPTYLKQSAKQRPQNIREFIPGARNLTSLLTAQNDQLFIVEEQMSIPKPRTQAQLAPKTLADEEGANLDEIHEIMRQNRDFENIIEKDLWWKGFDSQNEQERLTHLCGLLDQYLNHLLQSDYQTFQLPILCKNELVRKLRSLASQLITTQSVHNMVKCITQEDLFQEIENAMYEIGQPAGMKEFVRQELQMQMNVKYTVEEKGFSNQRITGPVPRSLQIMTSPIKNKVEIDYHIQKKEESLYPVYQTSEQSRFERQMQEAMEDDNDSQSSNNQYAQPQRNLYTVLTPKEQPVGLQTQGSSEDNFIGETDEEYHDNMTQVLHYKAMKDQQYDQRTMGVQPEIQSQDESLEREQQIMTQDQIGVINNHGSPLSRISPEVLRSFINEYMSPNIRKEVVRSLLSEMNEHQKQSSGLLQMEQQLYQGEGMQTQQDVMIEPLSLSQLQHDYAEKFLKQLSVIIEQDHESLSRDSSSLALPSGNRRSRRSTAERSMSTLMAIAEELGEEENSPKDISHVPISHRSQLPSIRRASVQSSVSPRRSSIRPSEQQPSPIITHEILPSRNSFLGSNLQQRHNSFSKTLKRPSFQFDQRRFSTFEQLPPLVPQTLQQTQPQPPPQIRFAYPPTQVLSKPPSRGSIKANKQLCRAVQKHMERLNESQINQNAYEQFEQQWFNTVKEETGAKYFNSNEEKYKKFVFNDNNEEIQMKFRLKQLLLQKEYVESKKPDYQKLFEKIKSLKNPFINELFITENNPTPSMSSQRSDETLSEKIVQYQQEYEQLRQELKHMLQNTDQEQEQINNARMGSPIKIDRLESLNTKEVSSESESEEMQKQESFKLRVKQLQKATEENSGRSFAEEKISDSAGRLTPQRVEESKRPSFEKSSDPPSKKLSFKKSESIGTQKSNAQIQSETKSQGKISNQQSQRMSPIVLSQRQPSPLESRLPSIKNQS